MMPVILFPQLITCGLLMPRKQMPEVLEWLSRVFPLTYAVEAMTSLAAAACVLGRVIGNTSGDRQPGLPNT